MAEALKVLWVVNYDDVITFADRARAIGAERVAVRSDNDLKHAISECHARGIEVFGWRWPSSKRDAAMREADKIAAAFDEGLDGYYADPEGEPGKPYDWNRPGLVGLARDFCDAITRAANGKPFGVTSHYRARAIFPHLPWEIFFQYATTLLPQAYWRVDGGVVGHGIVADNYRKAIQFWVEAGGERQRIVPMAGELGHARPDEIAAYATVAGENGIHELHFYTYDESVEEDVWQAVRDV